MRTVCEQNKCTACMACVDICPRGAIHVSDGLKYENAVIDEQKCIDCHLCEKTCQIINPTPLYDPIFWTQGWNRNAGDHRKSSSGAFAYSLAKQEITEGGYVASCTFENGEFIYSIAEKIDDLEAFRESKYVKSNPIGIYLQIKELLQHKKKALFIGLPCHVAGLKKYLGVEYDNLITVDLICHGSPSPKILEMFLKQYKIALSDLRSIHFRQKGNFRLTGEGSAQETKNSHAISFTEAGIRDRYSFAFLNGLTYSENCYYCAYAGLQRISDITIGDSWGSELDENYRKEGISLALCQSEKGRELLKRCDIELHEVNIDKAIAANHQLREPFPLPENRELFFELIQNGTPFNKAVAKCFPKACFRLDLKNTLLKTGLLKSSGGGTAV